MTRSNTEILQSWGHLSTWHLFPASTAMSRKVVGGEWERTKAYENHVETFFSAGALAIPIETSAVLSQGEQRD